MKCEWQILQKMLLTVEGHNWSLPLPAFREEQATGTKATLLSYLEFRGVYMGTPPYNF